MAVMTVAVTVVTVAAAATGGTVEQHAHAVELPGLVVALNLRQQFALHEVGTHHEHREVGVLGNHAGIGHYLHGRAVQENHVVPGAQLVHERLQARAEEQFRRVGRNGTHRQHLQVLNSLYWHLEGGPVLQSAVQVLGQTLFGAFHIFAQGSAPEVQVQGNHLLPLDGEGRGYVHGEESFTGARIHGREHDDTRPLGGILHEFDIGSHYAEGFVHDAAATGLHQDGPGIRHVLF